MINKLLYNLTARLPCRLISLDSGPYLERYYVGKVLGVTFYLHRFVSSDSERHMHNHPWTWGRALVLAGHYVEESCVDIAERGCITQHRVKRWSNRVDGNHFHRIHDAAPGTWTLFAHGERARVHRYDCDKGWGFLDPRHVPGLGATTVFVPWMSAPTDWWEEAAKGDEIGRQPL